MGPDGAMSSSTDRHSGAGPQLGAGTGRRKTTLTGEGRQRVAGHLMSRRIEGWRFWRSPMLRRILTLNLIALAIPVLGLLHLSQYRDSLIQAELKALATQGQVFALALGATSVLADRSGRERLVPELTRHQLRLLLSEAGLRARLYGPTDRRGVLMVDSFQLPGPNGVITIRPLLPYEHQDLGEEFLSFLDSIFDWLPGAEMAVYEEGATRTAADFEEVQAALRGETSGAARRGPRGELVLTMAVPVQRYRQVLGALLLSREGTAIVAAVDDRRGDVLLVFAVATSVTILLSLYLAGTIARPIRSLARAADQVKSGKGKKIALPDYSKRRDEIGELGRALTAMTDALWARLDAIEGFAADVSHEIKNPLTSLKSAVETVARVSDPQRREQLMQIILDDVGRLDRLITDISEASRVDAEMARADGVTVNLAELLSGLVEIERLAGTGDGPRFVLDLPRGRTSCLVMGLEGRLGQVFRNIIANAASFSPPGAEVRLALRSDGDKVEVRVEDEGPGIPENKLEAIFSRFYTERPEREKFGTHSGLGLSISKQIVEAHHGQIWAENRKDAQGRCLGATFVIRLDAYPGKAA
ncbi:MAG: stimulus-sensing domain-containing protein [Rhodospirillales bacterium]